jgi:hypothetical protein
MLQPRLDTDARSADPSCEVDLVLNHSVRGVMFDDASPRRVDEYAVLAAVGDDVDAQVRFAVVPDLDVGAHASEDVIPPEFAFSTIADDNAGAFAVVDSVSNHDRIAPVGDFNASAAVAENVVDNDAPLSPAGHFDAERGRIIPSLGRVPREARDAGADPILA